MCGTHEPLAQVCNWTTEDVESRQQTHYFHCDQIGIPREMTDDKGDLGSGIIKDGKQVRIDIIENRYVKFI